MTKVTGSILLVKLICATLIIYHIYKRHDTLFVQ